MARIRLLFPRHASKSTWAWLGLMSAALFVLLLFLFGLVCAFVVVVATNHSPRSTNVAPGAIARPGRWQRGAAHAGTAG